MPISYEFNLNSFGSRRLLIELGVHRYLLSELFAIHDSRWSQDWRESGVFSCFGRADQRDIVVLAKMDYFEMMQALNHGFHSNDVKKVWCKTGVPWDLDDLKKVFDHEYMNI